MATRLKHGIVLIVCVVFSLGADKNLSVGQAITTSIERQGPGLDYREWSSDGQRLVYYNGYNAENIHPDDILEGVVLTQPLWESFNPQMEMLISGNVWPLQPKLTPQEQQIYQTTDFIRTSPDGQILLFAGSSPNDLGLFPLVIANRLTQQVFSTDDINLDEINNALGVQWSADGSQIAVNAMSPSPYLSVREVYYLNIVDRNNLDATVVEQFKPTLAGREFITDDPDENSLFDVNDSGDLVLLTASENPPDLAPTERRPVFLVVWKPQQPEASLIIDAFQGKYIWAAAFVPNNNQQIVLFVGGEGIGIYLYDLVSKQKQLLAPVPDALDTLFSPDGEWLMTQSDATLNFWRIRDLIAASANALEISQ